MPSGARAGERPTCQVLVDRLRRLGGVTDATIAARRLHASGLLGLRSADPSAVVGRLGAVQAQDYPGAAWGIAQRVGGLTLAEITAAYDAGRIVRTHALRPTWHFLVPDHLRRVQALTGPRVLARNAAMDRRLGNDGVWPRCRSAIVDALAGGRHRTRAELSTALAATGVEATGQRLAYIVMRAEFEGLICSGPFRGKQITYALVEERIPESAAATAGDDQAFDRDTARADLVRRYFASHGPALIRDFVWWSGLTATDARAAIASLGDELRPERIGGKEYWSEADAPLHRDDAAVEPGTIHLLPNYDEYVGSYADKSPIFDDRLPTGRTIADDLGVHIVVREGLVVGGWKRRVETKGVTVDMTILLPLDRRAERSLEAALDAYGRHLGLPVTVNRRDGGRRAGR